MRFATLSLERYGRFEDCELSFRQGDPDLHVVYGANEAGKSTSLAAVSDLLFGFPARSPYNFVYDYALLRVGAVLEDEGHSFACRRKKGTAGTLIDAEDRLLDEAMLLSIKDVSILHGKGNGILRRVVRELLSRTKHVASFEDATLETGGHGITRVKLK